MRSFINVDDLERHYMAEAERLERQGKPQCAESYRHALIEDRPLWLAIQSVLSVEIGGEGSK